MHKASLENIDAIGISNTSDKKGEMTVLLERKAELEEQIRKKSDEAAYLKELIRQRESSISWRFSQFYGRYFSIKSLPTRILRRSINTILSLRKEDKQSPNNIKAYKQELDKILRARNKYVKGIIIYPPSVDWNIPLFQRPQQLALKISQLGYLVFYSCGTNEFDQVDGFKKITDNCYVTNQYELLVKELSSFALIISSTNQILSTSDIDKIKSRAVVVYEYIDEIHPDISGERMIGFIKKRHKYMIENANVILTTADNLYEEIINDRSDGVYLNPNGVDYSHFHIQHTRDGISQDMRRIIEKGKPIIGYYGALAKWFDYDIIKELAKARPGYEIVLIGWDYDGTLHKAGLDQFDNVHYLGVIKYPELPKYAIWFDVSIIPFVLNKLTESTSPIKIFEYMALGTPIVTTDLRECRKYSSVLIGKDYQEFIIKLDDALKLKNDPHYLSLLDKDARANTWEQRAQDIIDAVEKVKC
jgi:glycosyltransferase involved in cell wall biosynthesis